MVLCHPHFVWFSPAPTAAVLLAPVQFGNEKWKLLNDLLALLLASLTPPALNTLVVVCHWHTVACCADGQAISDVQELLGA